MKERLSKHIALGKRKNTRRRGKEKTQVGREKNHLEIGQSKGIQRKNGEI